MKQLIIRDNGEQMIAKVNKVLSCSAEDTLANAKTLSFTTLLEGGLTNLREEVRYTVEFENDLYDIVSFKKSMNGNLCFIEISCEHVSYRLNDKKLEMYSKTGTAKEVLMGLLEGTGFLAGTEELSREVTYSSQTSGTVRAVLLDFAGSFGYEVVFHRFTVSLVPHRGEAKDTKILNGNVLEINKTIDLTQNTTAYSLKVKPKCPIGVGDEVHLVYERLGINDHVRVLGIKREPFVNEHLTLEVGAYEPDLESDSVRVVTNLLSQEKSYYGTRISAEKGLEIKRSDNLASVTFNADTMAFYQGSEEIECGWTGAMISRMIGLERYCGDVLLQKTYTPDFLSHRSVKNEGQKPQYMVRDHHPAIIDRELFESVQAVRRYNADRFKNRGKEKTLYAFSSRLTCAHCGRYFNIRNAENNRIWFCPTAALNNGKNTCHAEKVYEEQVVRMFRRAFIDRFDLVAEPVLDDVTVADIMSGRYGQDEESTCSFTQKADDFVSQIWTRLNNVQRTDNMERDRGFLKRQIDALQVTITEAGKRTRRLISEKDTLETRRDLLGDANVTDEEIAAVRERLETETARLQEAQSEKGNLEQRLADLEAYWEKLEADYEEREKALEWMKTLPEGHEGTVAFLNGLTSDYVRAFALDIIVYDPLHYTVYWFDDTKTKVEMYSNVEDFRYTSDYFDGQRMRSKREFRRA